MTLRQEHKQGYQGGTVESNISLSDLYMIFIVTEKKYFR